MSFTNIQGPNDYRNEDTGREATSAILVNQACCDMSLLLLATALVSTIHYGPASFSPCFRNVDGKAFLLGRYATVTRYYRQILHRIQINLSDMAVDVTEKSALQQTWRTRYITDALRLEMAPFGVKVINSITKDRISIPFGSFAIESDKEIDVSMLCLL